MKKRTMWNTDSFKERMSEVNPNITILGEYRTNKTTIECQCNICGKTFPAYPCNLLKGSGCGFCNSKGQYSHADFIKKLSGVDNTIQILSQYKNSQTAVTCKCKVCGNIWPAKPYSLLAGHGCPPCHGINKVTTESLNIQIKAINPTIEVLEYKSARKKVRCKCLLCNNEFPIMPGDLRRGHGCPNCARRNSSYVEKVIFHSFIFALGDDKVLSRDKRAIGRELDIYIPSLRFAIEPGAWDFHKNKLANDAEKKRLCNENGIHLEIIYISYHEDQPIDGTLTYKSSLSLTKDSGELRNLVLYLFELSGLTCTIDDLAWKTIQEKAYISSRKYTTEEFKRIIASINPDIEILGEYTASANRIRCRCKTCGKIWDPKANDLINGSGCRKCADKRKGLRQRLSENEFLSRVPPSIEVLGKFTTTSERIKCKCKICDNIWEPYAGSLLRGVGCKKCYDSRRGNKTRMSQEKFENKVYAKNDTVKIVGTYINRNTDIEYICKICGKKRVSKASNLLAGCGCRECYRKRSK